MRINEVMKMKDEDDIEEFKEVMRTINETVPRLIKSIVEAIYSTQSAEEFGKQVANFYKAMIDAGMDKEQAYQLTKEFMESRDIAGIIKKILSRGNWSDWKKEGKNVDEIVADVMKEVREETMKEVKKEVEEEKNDEK